MNSDFCCDVLVINLDADLDKKKNMSSQLAQFSGLFNTRFVRAIDGRLLSEVTCLALCRDQKWKSMKGTIGCFLSHVSAWEMVASLDAGFAVILEDDTDVTRLGDLMYMELPADAEIVFLNERMSPNLEQSNSPPVVLPIWHSLVYLESIGGGPGGDGYLLTSAAAKKLVEAVAEDHYFGHVDGRLLRYGTSEDDLKHLSDSSRTAFIVRHHHHNALTPRLGLLRGYCTSIPLVRHDPRGVSRRVVHDGQ